MMAERKSRKFKVGDWVQVVGINKSEFMRSIYEEGDVYEGHIYQIESVREGIFRTLYGIKKEFLVDAHLVKVKEPELGDWI